MPTTAQISQEVTYRYEMATRGEGESDPSLLEKVPEPDRGLVVTDEGAIEIGDEKTLDGQSDSSASRRSNSAFVESTDLRILSDASMWRASEDMPASMRGPSSGTKSPVTVRITETS